MTDTAKPAKATEKKAARKTDDAPDVTDDQDATVGTAPTKAKPEPEPKAT
jgi:hypothetical protein